MKVVEEKEREKCRERNGEKERNVNVRESQKSNFFLGFRVGVSIRVSVSDSCRVEVGVFD